MYTCDQRPCPQLGAVVRKNLAAVGIRVVVRTFPVTEFYERTKRASEPFDIATVGWAADQLDPDNFVGLGLDGGTVGSPSTANYAHFSSPKWDRRLDAAARLSGAARYLTYGRLADDIAREEAPWAVFGNIATEDFLSARVGCAVYQPLYGMDLAALCLR